MLIGTIFTTDDLPVVREFMGQLSAHFYENGSGFVTQLLQYSGFTVVELEARPEGGFRFQAEKKTYREEVSVHIQRSCFHPFSFCSSLVSMDL